MLCEPHGEDNDGLTECLTDYINFYIKSWVTKDIKAILNAKKRAFRDNTIQDDLKLKIREAKDRYRRKLEWKLQQNNMRQIWSGMKTITGQSPAGNRGVKGDIDRATELNLFFNRFDAAPTHPFSDSSVECKMTTCLLPTTTS